MMTYFNIMEEFCRSISIEFTNNMYDKFYKYMQVLIEYNKKVNLTSIIDEENIIRRHFIDSISLLNYKLYHGCILCDVGTGAGFPGLPLKIVRPDIKLTLIEATTKKVKFLEYIISLLGIDGIIILNDRVENISHDPRYREKFDYVISRAMARLNRLLELSFPLVRLNGEYISLKGNKAMEELNEASKCIEILGGVKKKVITLSNLNSNIIILKKNRSTPIKYPRQYNLILKKTL